VLQLFQKNTNKEVYNKKLEKIKADTKILKKNNNNNKLINKN